MNHLADRRVQAVAPRSDGLRRVRLVPMTQADLDAVTEVEKTAYAHPWSRRHFSDSLQAKNLAVLLLGEAGPTELACSGRSDGHLLLGYQVAMLGIDEVHLLNLTIAPAQQRQGWARCMLDALVLWSLAQQAQCLWLEVRQSNTPARRFYERYGFVQVGLRRNYYPLDQFQREDAVVMRLNLATLPTGGAVEATR